MASELRSRETSDNRVPHVDSAGSDSTGQDLAVDVNEQQVLLKMKSFGMGVRDREFEITEMDVASELKSD